MKKVILAHRYNEEAVERLRREFQLLITDSEGLNGFLSDPIEGDPIGSLKRPLI